MKLFKDSVRRNGISGATALSVAVTNSLKLFLRSNHIAAFQAFSDLSEIIKIFEIIINGI